MASLTTIREAIRDQLLEVFGTTGPQADLGITVTATIESPPQAPALQVLKGVTDYSEAMQGSVNLHHMIVRALFPLPADEAAQNLLDDLLSFPGELDPDTGAPIGRSLKSAIEAVDDDGETTLSGQVGSVTVLNSTSQRIYTIAGNEYLGADLNLEVWA